MVVYVDMDGVLADWVDGFNRKFEGVISYEDFNNSPSDVRDEYRLLIDSDPDFYRMLSPNLDLIDLIHRFRAEGVNVEILTSVGDSHSDLIAEQKRLWIERYIGSWIQVNVVNTSRDKSLYVKSNKDILIDDREKALGPFREAGGYAIRYEMNKVSLDVVEGFVNGVLSQSF